MKTKKDTKDKLLEDISYLNPEDWKKVNRFVAKLKTLENMEAKEFKKMVSKGLADQKMRYYDEIMVVEKPDCSFCGKNQDVLTFLIAGPGVYICNECLETCYEIMAEKGQDLMPDISRFDTVYPDIHKQALADIKEGRALDESLVNCLLPQPLGCSGTTVSERCYGISGKAEAASYLKDKELRQELLELCTVLLELKKADLKKILPPPCDKKLHISMTMFRIVWPRCKTVEMVLDKFFGGKLDRRTEVLCREVWK